MGLRPFIVYGLGRDQGMTSDPTKAMLAAAAGVPFRIKFSGSMLLTYAPDCARAFIESARAAAGSGETVSLNVPGRRIGVPALAGLIDEILPGTGRLVTWDSNSLPVPSLLASPAIYDAVGDVPNIALADGVRETIKGFQDALAAGLVSAPPHRPEPCGTADAPGPLSHLRVLDFTALVQGPLATQILGDLGADVVKIERVEGEWSRHWGILDGHTHGQTDSFLAFNRNKRSVTADLKDEQARERILALAPGFDVVVENFRPGVMARLGLGYDAFAERNPAIIFVSSSGYGQTGPYVTRPGQDMLIQALTGMLWLTGRAGIRPPRRHRDRGPVHRAAHRDRHPGRAGAPAPDRPGTAGRAGPVQLHDLGPAAGTDLLPQPRLHPAAAG